MIRTLRTGLAAVIDRYPALGLVLFGAWAFVWRPFVRMALLPFRVEQGSGSAAQDSDLVRRTTAYNAAAERYFAEYADPRFLLDKPFSEARLFPQYLVSAGTLLAGAKLQPGDTVVEFGAGSCWLSHLLNRYGCRTIAIDVPGWAAMWTRLHALSWTSTCRRSLAGASTSCTSTWSSRE